MKSASILRSWKTAFLLAIIVPLSLMTGFKMAGMIQSPSSVAETVTLNSVIEEYARPSKTHLINSELQASYDSDGLSANMRVLLVEYSDKVAMCLSANSSALQRGFIDNIRITFQDDEPSIVYWSSKDITHENLSLISSSDAYTSKQGSQAGRFLFAGSRKGDGFNFSARYMYWDLRTPHNVTHQLNVTYEITYYNGTVFKKVIQPFELKLNANLHFLSVSTTPLVPGGGTPRSGIKVWIDGAEYASPISELILSQGNYSIECESPTYIDSKKYEFNDWHPIGGLANPTTIMLTGDVDLVAYYEEYCELLINVTEGGWTSFSSGVHDFRARDFTQLTVYAYNNSGFVFNHWTLDGVDYFVNPIPITMDRSHVLTAHFDQSGT